MKIFKLKVPNYFGELVYAAESREQFLDYLVKEAENPEDYLWKDKDYRPLTRDEIAKGITEVNFSDSGISFLGGHLE